ncbi:2-dehydropantoate 2-reductase [Pseudalkalibacillus decolorationis]|uniref:2-dehydropantoate 2-reductase n=1 Tax=Pseudalkalibacillus decolorationis TaxID=163879 RepID=UPI002149750E|nr:2-dehydropantoate 2-reductase [Pseudalkalibacillus decolorationis]
MRVAIIGGGSVGLLFAAYLQKNRHEVTLYVRRKEQQTNLQQSGLVVHSLKTEFTTHPKVRILDTSPQESYDLVIVAVKSYDLELVLPILANGFNHSRSLLLLQNGMLHTRWISDLTMFSVYLGSVEHGALRESDTEVLHTGVGRTKVAPYLDGRSGLNWDKLSIDVFPFQQEADWYNMLCKKLMINTVINPLTALLRVKNGDLLEQSNWLQMMERLFQETCRVMDVSEIETSWKELINVCENTSSNKSSMLRDIENGHRTEIDAITGYVLMVAEQKGIPIPYNQFIYQAIKGMEDHN